MRKLFYLLIAVIFLAGCKEKGDDSMLPLFMAWDNESSFKDLKTDAEKEKYLQRLKDSHIDGLFLEGKPQFIREIAPIAKKVNVKIHVWKPTMINSDSLVLADHKDWFSVSGNNESSADKPPYVPYYKILCPREPQVLEYLKNVYLEYAKIDGVAGIHFDYIRYCDVYLPIALLPKYNLVQDHEMPEFDFCYCHRCREAFKAETGIDPLTMKDPASSKEWAEFRLKAIVDVVNAVTAEVKKQTGKIVTSAVFPTPEMSKRMVRQDWGNFKIDAVCPMLYNGFYKENTDWIGKCVKEGIETMAVKKDLHAGVMMDDLKTPELLQAAIKSAMDNGAKGVVFFTAHMTDEQLAVVKKEFKNYYKK